MNRIQTQLFSILNGYSSSVSDFHIAFGLLHHLQDVENFSLKEMAQACDCSSSKLLRFLKNIGYDNYASYKNYTNMAGIIKEQLEQRYFLYDEKKNKEALFQLSNAASLQEFLQEDVLDQIVEAIKKSSKIVVVGAIEMQSQFVCFQSDLWQFGKPVYLEFGNTLHPYYKLQENDLLIICSMSGRILSMSPVLLDSISPHQNTLLISKFPHSPSRLFLQIPSDHEIFEAYMILSFYLDQIKYQYYKRYVYDSDL